MPSHAIVNLFQPLNPYRFGGSILRIEAANYPLVDGKRCNGSLHELYVWDIAVKRYVLFTIGPDGRPVLQKASGHGLGHLLPPYDETEAPASIPALQIDRDDLGVDRWEHDVWYRIVEAVLAGHPNMVKLDDLPGFDQPALSRYAATTPKLLSWYRPYNQERPYRERVRPFGFLLAFHSTSVLTQSERHEVIHQGTVPKGRARRRSAREDLPRAIAPYDRDHAVAARQCFDQQTGSPVDVQKLKTYRQALLQYHLQPEAKFENGRHVDRGETIRRHVVASSVQYVGKEANRWEEQFHLRRDPEAQTEYCTVRARLDHRSGFREQRVLDQVREQRAGLSLRQVAKLADVHVSHLSEALTGKRKPSADMVSTLETWLQDKPSV